MIEFNLIFDSSDFNGKQTSSREKEIKSERFRLEMRTKFVERILLQNYWTRKEATISGEIQGSSCLQRKI